MNDLELTKACAEAMGYQHRDDNGQLEIMEQRRDRHEWRLYDPLKRDAQAMALVKKLRLHPIPDADREGWWDVHAKGVFGTDPDLNRAIVECVAKMQSTK